MQQTIYVSKKNKKCYALREVGEQVEIDVNNPVTVDLTKYKRVSDNNAFYIYELKKKNQTEMTVEEALQYVIGEDTYEGKKRKHFSNSDAADTYSESLKHLWPEGLGLVYGPFVDPKNNRWWEVSYK